MTRLAEIEVFVRRHGELMGMQTFERSSEMSDSDAIMLQKIHQKIRWADCGHPPDDPSSPTIKYNVKEVQAVLKSALKSAMGALKSAMGAAQLVYSTDRSRHELLPQYEGLEFLNAILNGAINRQQARQAEETRAQEIHINQICSQFLTMARFIVAPFEDKDKFNGFLASDQAQGLATGGEKPVASDQGDSLTCHEDLSACDETLKTTMANLTAGFLAIAKKESETIGGTTTIGKIQLAYHEAVTGKSSYAGAPQGRLLTESYTEPLAAFLADYPLFIGFFLENMECYQAMAVNLQTTNKHWHLRK